MKEKMGHLAVRAEVFILIILCVRVGVKYAGQCQSSMIAGRNQSKEQVQTKEQMQSEKQLQGEEQVWTGKQTQTDGKLESVGEVQTGVEQIGKTIQKTTQSDELGKVYVIRRQIKLSRIRIPGQEWRLLLMMDQTANTHLHYWRA